MKHVHYTIARAYFQAAKKHGWRPTPEGLMEYARDKKQAETAIKAARCGKYAEIMKRRLCNGQTYNTATN